MECLSSLPIVRMNKKKGRSAWNCKHKFMSGGNMETTVIYSDGDTLKTDVILRKWLGGQRKFIAIIEGDSLIIKKTYSLLDFSSEPDEDFMSMEEINKEVHKTRKENEHSR